MSLNRERSFVGAASADGLSADRRSPSAPHTSLFCDTSRPRLLPMEVRPATPDDVPAVLPMVRAVAAFHEQLDPAKYSFRGDPGAMYDDWLRKRASDSKSVFL